jgi:hypothetical protein
MQFRIPARKCLHRYDVCGVVIVRTLLRLLCMKGAHPANRSVNANVTLPPLVETKVQVRNRIGRCAKPGSYPLQPLLSGSIVINSP